jgi:methyl-accepting chemotaxis protein
MAKGDIRWYSTIRMKVVIVVIISCTLVLGGLSAYNTINEQKKLSGDLQKLAQVTSQRLSKHLIGPMWDLDRGLVDSTLEAEMLEENIHAIVVWDEGAGSIFSARERGPGGSLVASNGAISGDLLESKNDINTGTQSIGEVAVFVSKQQLNQQLRESTIANVITLVALIIVMAIVMTIVMNQIIIGPITRLAKHADDISHGDLKQNIVPESNDEIGQLAEAFHRMQTSLRVAFKRIYAKARSA